MGRKFMSRQIIYYLNSEWRIDSLLKMTCLFVLSRDLLEEPI